MEFNSFKLEEICTVITDGSHFSPKASFTGFPMLSVKDMRDFDFDYEKAKMISEEDYKKLVKNGCQPLPNDVLIAKDGNTSLEYCFVFRERKEVVLLSSIAILRPNINIVNPYYLMYYLSLKSTKEELKQGYLSGSAIPRVVLKDFKRYSLKLPSLKQQNSIVSLIKAINSKIETNTGIIKNLEQLAQILYKRWFIDFDFPNEDGEPYKFSGGEMVNSKIGEIPKSWMTTSIYDLANYINGASFKSKDFDLTGFPVIKITELKNGLTSQTKYYNKNDKAEKYFIYNKDILFSWSGNPETSIDTFVWVKNKALLNQHIFKIESKEIFSKAHLYTLYKYLKPVFTRIAMDKQTTGLGHITLNDLKRLRVVQPNEFIIKEFEAILTPIFESIYIKLKEKENLESLRNTLLPKLLSGEIELPDETEVTEHVPIP